MKQTVALFKTIGILCLGMIKIIIKYQNIYNETYLRRSVAVFKPIILLVSYYHYFLIWGVKHLS